MKRILLVLVSCFFAAAYANAADYQYISAKQASGLMGNGSEIIIVDIQIPEEFSKAHLKGAIETNAYPVKSDEDKAKLDGSVAVAKKSYAPVIIVCPRGKGGAKRTYDYMSESGIQQDRLFILEGGQQAWPYDKVPEGG